MSHSLTARGGRKAPAAGFRPRIRRRDFLKIAAAAGLGLVIPEWLSGRAEAALRVGDIPPVLSLSDLKGNIMVIPSDFKRRIALIHFWASWCPLCRPEMTVLESLSIQYRKTTVIPCSIGLGESKEAAEAYIRNLKISYPVLVDPKSSARKPYGISGIPTTYVLNRENVVRYRILGEINKDGLDRMVKTLL